MKVKFNTEELKKALSKLAAVVTKKSTLPVYGYVRLFAVPAAGGLGFRVGMIGVDVDATLTVGFLKAEPDGPVDVLLPFGKLLDIVGSVTNTDATIETDGESKARIKDGKKYTGEMKPRPLSEWPQLLERPDTALTIVGLPGLKDQIGKVEFAVRDNDGKFTVTVARVESSANGLKLVGTDGFGLALSNMPANYGDWVLTLPKPALELVSKLEGTQLTISETEGGFFFDTESDSLTVSRSHGTFPDYNQIVPKTYRTKITIADKTALIDAIKRSKPLADDEKPVIIFAVAENGTELRMQSASMETISEGTAFRQTAEDTLEGVVVEGPAVDFSLNVTSTLKFLDKATGPIVIQVTDHSAIVDFQANGGTYRWMQMPTAPATRV